MIERREKETKMKERQKASRRERKGQSAGKIIRKHTDDRQIDKQQEIGRKTVSQGRTRQRRSCLSTPSLSNLGERGTKTDVSDLGFLSYFHVAGDASSGTDRGHRRG